MIFDNTSVEHTYRFSRSALGLPIAMKKCLISL